MGNPWKQPSLPVSETCINFTIEQWEITKWTGNLIILWQATPEAPQQYAILVQQCEVIIQYP